MGEVLRWMAFEIRVWTARRVKDTLAVDRGDEVEAAVLVDEAKERRAEKERIVKS